MHYNSDQVIEGITNYANEEVIGKLPTLGKWVLGTGIGMAHDRVRDIVINLQGNSALRMLGVVDEDGNFCIDELADYMKDSANRYGKAYVNIPLLGNMTFTAEDIEKLKRYIERA